MQPPKALRIGHTIWAIGPDRRGCDALEADGFTDANTRRIGYRPGLARDRRCEVLLHEAFHAAVEVARGHGLDYEHEELVVDALTGPLLDLLRDNPTFVAYLTGGSGDGPRTS